MEATIDQVHGMGAVVSEKGTNFRVWAPNADTVFVSGTFNNWSEDKHALSHEENGYWSVYVEEAKDRDEYKYIITNGDEILFRNDPYAREMSNSNGNSIITNQNFEWEDEGFQIKPWNQLVIYELHVGTFLRKDKEAVGTFEDVITKIPYLKSLGINCVELLPVAEFAGGISWGYNPAAPFAIEKDYGGAKSFAKLINELHKNGIAVIMDVVYNHFGPSDMDLWRFDGWSENGKGGIYFYNDHRSDTPWGDTRPDYGRPEVRRYIRDNALMWIEEYHCDGLRMDATSYIRFEGGGLGYDTEIHEGNILMRDINSELQERYPGVITIAEDLKGHDLVTLNVNAGGIGYGSQWDMNFVHPVREILIQQGDESRDLQSLVDAILFQYNNDVFERVIYTESHDEVANGQARVPEEIQPGGADSFYAKKRAVLGTVLTLTSPGIPMLFQGQEFLEDEYFQDSEALDWNQEDKHRGIKNLIADIIKLRTGETNSAHGLRGQFTRILHFNEKDKVIGYARSASDQFDDSTIILINLSATNFEEYSFGIPSGESLSLKINTDWSGYDKDSTGIQVPDPSVINKAYDTMPCMATTKLPAYSALIFISSEIE